MTTRNSTITLDSLIGQAEMEIWIQEIVKRINQGKDRLEIYTEQQQPVELDESELEKYLDFVIRTQQLWTLKTIVTN